MAIGERDLRRFLVDRVARACELAPADVDPDRLLEQFGIASRDAVAITAELEDVLGRQLEPASLWRYPTLNQLIRGVLGSTHPDGIPIAPVDSLTGDEIAVIGLARDDDTAPSRVAREALARACVPESSRTALFGTAIRLLGRDCPAEPSSTPAVTAMASLRNGSSDIALAVLSGRGCQMVVLKRLADAERDSNQILALCTDPDAAPPTDPGAAWSADAGGPPVADFAVAVLAADRGMTDELVPWPVGRTVSTREAVVRRARPHDPTPSTGPTRLLLSDESIELVQEYAGVLAAYLRDDLSRNTADVAHTLVRRIARGPIRAAVIGRSRADLTAGLTSLAQGNEHPGVVSAEATIDPPQPTWVFPPDLFPGQRTPTAPEQPSGLRELAESVPGFAELIVELDPLVVWASGVSVREAVRTSTVPTGGELPVAFAVQVALALTLREYGVAPAAIVAAGAGEVAAAVVAGALTATEGARLIAAMAVNSGGLTPPLAEPRIPFYTTTSTESLSTTLGRAAADGYEHVFHLTADALAFHTQLAMLEVLGHPIVTPPGRVIDLPLAPWRPAP
jgi:acyl carrier protein